MGNKFVKIIGKAEVEEQICLNGVFNKKDNTIDPTQKSYIEFTQGNDLADLEAKIAKVNLEMKKLFETMNLASIQDKPGFVEFPSGGSRYPSGRNRY